MRHLIIFYFLFVPLIVSAQDCDCVSNFEWVKKTFEENDAGFAFALEQKGEGAYQSHNEMYIQRVADITNSSECTQALYEWLTFFRKGHIAIRNLNQGGNAASQETLSDAEIIEQFKDWERLEVDVLEFEEYLKNKKDVDFEGIWISDPYKIGIKKVGDDYIGFIIKAEGAYWTESQVKLKIYADGTVDYYMGDHSTQSFESAELLIPNFLQMGFVTFKRELPVIINSASQERYTTALNASQPYFEKIDEETSYIRIPTFNGGQKGAIDDVISDHLETILSTENFIIDIRNNGGGSDRSYKELLPILYTNPIRSIGVEMYSTKLNNQRMLDFINKEEYGFNDDEKEWAQESYDALSARLGEFVNLNSFGVDIISYDTLYPFPKNVGVIINENNGSTAEQFLLDAKQSQKVKLFGRTTVGVLDISNMYFVPSPCGEFELGYSLSKSMRIPHMAIDGKGIQPDYYIDDNIESFQWIEYVRDTLNP